MNNLGKSMNRVIGVADKTMKNVANMVKRDEVALLIGAIVVAYVSFLEKDSINPFSYFLSNAVIRAITLVLVIYIAMVNMPLGLLLTVAFVLTIAHNGGVVSGFTDMTGGMDMDTLGMEGFLDEPKVDGPGAAADLIEGDQDPKSKNGNNEEDTEGFADMEEDAEEGFEEEDDMEEDEMEEDDEAAQTMEEEAFMNLREGFSVAGQVDLKTLVTGQFKAERRRTIEDEMKTLIAKMGGNEGNMVEKILSSKPGADDHKKIKAEVKNLATTGKTLMDGASANFNTIPMLRGYVSRHVKKSQVPVVEGFMGGNLFAMA